jgi:hypothetical protein
MTYTVSGAVNGLGPPLIPMITLKIIIFEVERKITK